MDQNIMTNGTQIIPCPFCDGTVRTKFRAGMGLDGNWEIGCKPENNCPAHPSMQPYQSEAEAIVAWNTALSNRPPTSSVEPFVGSGENKEAGKCLDCGKSYSDFGMDVVLPRRQWLTIHPDNHGLLCAQCIVNRVSKIPEATVIHAVVEIRPIYTAADMVKQFNKGRDDRNEL